METQFSISAQECNSYHIPGFYSIKSNVKIAFYTDGCINKSNFTVLCYFLANKIMIDFLCNYMCWTNGLFTFAISNTGSLESYFYISPCLLKSFGHKNSVSDIKTQK